MGDVDTDGYMSSGQRSGLADLFRRHHSLIQQVIIEHTLCQPPCWELGDTVLPHETPIVSVKVVVNLMETDELAHGVCACVCA